MSVSSNDKETKIPAVPDADKLIDDILAAKGPQKYKNGLSEDNWEEELEQIPLFMTKVPENIDPVKGAGILALQDLKYQEDSPDCRALAYKEDGNELFKKKKYKEAVSVYSEGLKQGSMDAKLTAILYCNRATSHYHLGNMRSAILDATKSKSFQEDYLKAYIRGAEANCKLGKNREAIDWCEQGLLVDPTCKQLIDLRARATQDKRMAERDSRRRDMMEKDKTKEKQKLLAAIEARKISLSEQARGHQNENEDQEEQLSKLDELIANLSLSGPHPISKPVHLNERGELVWPVIFLYPEYGQSEVVLEFNENSQFTEHIEVMFGEDAAAPWDTDGKYKPQTIEVWYEDLSNGDYIHVPLKSTLGDVINGSLRYTVVSGTPSFIILAKGSKFKRQFLSRSS